MPFDPNQPRNANGTWKGKAAGGVLGAALLAGLTAAAGGGDATASVGAALDTAVSQSTVDADTASSQSSARKGNETEAWQRMSLRELKKEVKRDLRCAVQSYGRVQQFFLRHPCDKLDQQLFAVVDPQGDVIAGSVVWVRMPTKAAAAQFLQVEDTYGTGDVTPLGTEVPRLGGFRFTGKHYRSRPDGTLAVVAETEPISGHPSDTLLKEVATIADVLPPL